MKHMFLKSVTALVFSLAILATSCKKGDDGAKGDTGDKGDTGAKGATGATGATGTTGTANVIYSDWLNLKFTTIGSPDSSRGVAITVPKLTADIVSNGTVKVYWNLNTAADPYVVALPFTDPNGYFTGAKGLFITPDFYVGTIEMISNYFVSTQQLSSGDIIFQYRYVLIPGGTAARTAVNWNDYKQVKNYLGLKD